MRAIQSLRFFAVLMIFMSHLSFLENNGSQLVRMIYRNIFFEGFLGVTFFFILSGFILSHSYGKKMAKGQVDYFDYLIARIARIFPTHILTLIISLPLSISVSTLLNKGLVTIGTLGVNAFLLQSFIPQVSVYFSFNAPSWALSTLMFSYILFPFLTALRTRTLILISAFVIGYQLLAIIYFSTLDPIMEGQTILMLHFLIYIFPASRLIDFIVGILLYRSFYSRWRLSSGYATLLQVSACLACCSFFFYHNSIQIYYRFDLYYLIPLSFLIVAFSYENGCLAKVIDKNILVFFGSASFAFYMIHQIVIRYYLIAFRNNKYLLGRSFGAGEAGIFSACACLIISLLASVYLYKHFEIKARSKALIALSQIKKFTH